MGGAEGRSDVDVGLSRLLERERELQVLDRGIATTAAGGAALLLIEGPAGIGKSKLVAEARRRAAERGLLVLSARGGELEREFPFGVVRQLFESRLVDEGERERVLAGAAAGAAAVFGLPGERPDNAPSEFDLCVAPRSLLADGEPEHGGSAHARG